MIARLARFYLAEGPVAFSWLGLAKVVAAAAVLAVGFLGEPEGRSAMVMFAVVIALFGLMHLAASVALRHAAPVTIPLVWLICGAWAWLATGLPGALDGLEGPLISPAIAEGLMVVEIAGCLALAGLTVYSIGLARLGAERTTGPDQGE